MKYPKAWLYAWRYDEFGVMIPHRKLSKAKYSKNTSYCQWCDSLISKIQTGQRFCNKECRCNYNNWKKRKLYEIDPSYYLENRKKWGRTEVGRISLCKSACKRRGYKDISLMNNVFDNIPDVKKVNHHITDMFLIPFPKSIHVRYTGNDKQLHRKKIKEHWLYGFLKIEQIITEN